tara:strand:- start:198 stop:410 length:213 start_codon:yes stop_codon:yes gene_type:complete
MNNLLTISGAAYFLRTTAATVKRWVKSEELPAVVMPDGSLRFERSELAEWVQSRKQSAIEQDKGGVSYDG